MPTYEYECAKCGHVFERFQRISEKPLKRCPQCRGKVSRRIGAGAGILFKGSGFYTTDYRSETYKKAAQAEKGGGTAEAKAGPSSEKKAAGASEGKVKSS
jgi:putative FmdB family regulatory protein